MKLFIKNMVCGRCIMVVKSELEKLGYHTENVILGEAEINKVLSEMEIELIRETLSLSGFQLIDDNSGKLIEKIKTTIVQFVHYKNEDVKINLSEYLESKLHKDYTYLSNLFSSAEGTTIEKYCINQKIEKVKELIVYGELTLSEISYRLGYSSVAYLSNQFKKVTGLTPSHFKKIKEVKRKYLDKI
ncbi:MAG: AraC family transcriptional regulator [Candidatus Kapaibacterium sp.]